MQTYEYRVVPAPKRAEKVKGAKTTTDRFAHALTQLMNDLGRDGWEYQRADTLPCEERVGLTGRTTVFQHMLVFRRALVSAEVATPVPAAAAAPVPVFSRPAAVRPAERVLADYASLPARPMSRKLTADAPVGEAPRISLVQPVPEAVPAVGPATSEGVNS
jgi:hypothetical protein